MPAFTIDNEDFIKDGGNVIAVLPGGIVTFETQYIADIPDVVADPTLVDILIVKLFRGYALADFDCLEHGAVTETRAAHVIDFAEARSVEKMIKC